MPWESEILESYREAYKKCYKCNQPFHGFIRGIVQSSWRKFLGFGCCAIICQRCTNIIGWEKP